MKNERHWLEYGVFLQGIGTLIVACVAAGFSWYQGWVARDTEERQLRAYIGIEAIRLVLNAPEAAGQVLQEGQPGYIFADYISFGFKNFGATPAFNFTNYINFMPVPPGTELPPDFVFPDFPDSFPKGQPHPNIGGATIDRDQPYPGKHALRKTSVDQFKQAQQKIVVMYLWGHLDFCDVYDRRWRRRYAYIYLPWQGDKAFESLARNQGEQQNGKCTER